MRSAVIILVVLAALVAGFAAFMFMEPAPPAVRHVETATFSTTLPGPPSATRPMNGPGVGIGQNVWIQSFDKKSGVLVSEFRADRYDPPVDQVVHVVNANARFYQKSGSIMTLDAVTGDMVMPEQAKKSASITAMSTQPPSHGILYDVTIGLYDDADAAVPSLTCKMPILAFDNDTLSLATIAMRAGGQDILADRIPVTVRGRDYDFDGQGLKLRYNQRDQHLEFLEVAHGHRLLIKHPNNVGESPSFGAAPGTPVGNQSGPLKAGKDGPRAAGPVMLGDEPLELADTDKSVAAQMSAEERELHRKKRLAATQAAARAAAIAAAAATQPTTQKAPKEFVAYHATFNQNVHLKEGPAPVGESDQMIVTFTFGDNKSSSTQPSGQGATTAPVNGAAAASASPAEASTPANPGPRPVAPTKSPDAEPPQSGPLVHGTKSPGRHGDDDDDSDRAPMPTDSGTKTGKGTGKGGTPKNNDGSTDEQPIEVTWDGKLTVVPVKMPESGLTSAADHIVEFSGTPVKLNRQGSSVEAPYVWAGVEGGRFAAKNNAQFSVITLRDADGLTLKTESVTAAGDVVVIHGKSVATNSLAAGAGNAAAGADDTMVTHWSDTGTLHLITTSVGDRAIDHARFVGNVDVLHPQLHLKGDSLELGFSPDPVKPSPSVSAIQVVGNVLATMKAQDGTDQTINSKTLDLATASQTDGSMAVKNIHAVGDVKAVNAGDTLLSDDLFATLLPPNTPAAPGAKQPKHAGGSSSAALDHMIATGNVHFSTLDGNTAVSDILKVDRRPSDGLQDITLLGNPAVVTDPTNKITGKVVRIDSTGSAASVVGAGTMDGIAHTDADQTPKPISVTWTQSMDYDGAHDHVHVVGDVVIDTRGSDGSLDHAVGKTLDLVLGEGGIAATQSANGTALKGSGNTKTVKQMTLSEDVEVDSMLYSADDPTLLMRRMNLLGPKVIVDMAADGTIATMTVPSAGRLLFEDHGATTQPAATQPAHNPPSATIVAIAPPASPVPAAAASQPTSQPGMSVQGKTAVAWSHNMVYDLPSKKATLLGDVVVVHKSADQDPMRLTSPRMVADLEPVEGGQTQIKQVLADQGATFSNTKIRFESDHAIYQPADDRVIAVGTEREPVQVFDETGLSTGTFDEMWWNVKTNQPERLKNISVNSRGMH